LKLVSLLTDNVSGYMYDPGPGVSLGSTGLQLKTLSTRFVE